MMQLGTQGLFDEGSIAIPSKQRLEISSLTEL
jgi:hypothetical protein